MRYENQFSVFKPGISNKSLSLVTTMQRESVNAMEAISKSFDPIFRPFFLISA